MEKQVDSKAPRRDHRRVLKRLVVLITLALSLAVGGQSPQPMPVAVQVQWVALAKIMTFERRLAQAADTVTVGIIYQGQVRESDLARQRLTKAIRANPNAGGMSFNHISIDIADGADLERQLRSSGVDVIYVTPVRAVDVTRIADLCHQIGHLTLTGVPSYVKLGVGVGVGLKGGHLELLANLVALHRAGAELSSRVLALSRIVE